MMFKKEIRGSILALFCVSLGGLLLHLRIHPTSVEASNWIPFIFGVISTFALPFMFNCERTVRWAYIINALAVVVGTLTMAFYSVKHWEGPVTSKSILLQSTLADILILLAKLPLAQIILNQFTTRQITQQD